MRLVHQVDNLTAEAAVAMVATRMEVADSAEAEDPEEVKGMAAVDRNLEVAEVAEVAPVPGERRGATPMPLASLATLITHLTKTQLLRCFPSRD